MLCLLFKKFKKFKKFKQFFFVFLAIYGNNSVVLAKKSPGSDCSTATHPMPQLPKLQHPASVEDVFSYHLAMQLHAGLFILDFSGKPKKHLLKSYQLLNQGKKWRFVLSDRLSSRQISAQTVKQQLESRIKKRVFGYKKLDRLEGFARFLLGETKELKGIRIASDNTLEFDLTHPDPDLPLILADIRFAILPSEQDPMRGFGNYAWVAGDSKSVEIKRKNDSDRCDGLARIRFEKKSLPELRTQLPKSTLAGLMYPLTEQDLLQLRPQPGIYLAQSIAAPRLYFWGLNPNTLSFSKREALAGQLDRKSALMSCYPGNSIINSVIPKGYLGYLPDYSYLPDRPSGNLKTAKPLKISISSGIGSELCMKAILGKWFPDARILIQTVREQTIDWKSGNLDMIFSYLEGAGMDSSSEIFQAFMESNLLNFSDSNSEKIQQYYQSFRDAKSYQTRFNWAKKLNRAILGVYTLVPLFTPKTYYFLNKSVKPIANLVISPIQIRYEQLQLESQNLQPTIPNEKGS